MLDNNWKSSNYPRLLLTSFYDMDPSMIQALKLKQMVEEGLVPYRNIFREMKKQKSQAEITVYFYKVTPSVPASPSSPSTSSTSSASATPETASPAPPLPPPPQPTQHEDDEDENI